MMREQVAPPVVEIPPPGQVEVGEDRGTKCGGSIFFHSAAALGSWDAWNWLIHLCYNYVQKRV